MISPRCGKTISNYSVIDSTDKEAGLPSTYVYCRYGEMITLSALIAQLRDRKSLQQDLNIDFTILPWLEAQTELT
jgi:hypothetical protein